MKILQSLLILCCLVNIFCQELFSTEDNLATGNYLTEDYPSQDHLANPLQTLLRLARGRSPFFGLMGKRSTAKTQVTRKRHKFQSFVGLMGKRNLGEQSVPCDLPL